MVRPRTISDQQILETALHHFLEQGPSVSMDVIAADLGVSPQAILKRFSTKQELLIASVRPCGLPSWHTLVEQGPDTRPFDVQLSQLLTELAQFFVVVVRKMELLRWSGISIQQVMATLDEPPPVRDIQSISGWLRRAWESGMIREVDFEATAMFVLTSMHGPAMLREFLGKNPTAHSQHEYISQYVDLLLRGMIDTSQPKIPR